MCYDNMAHLDTFAEVLYGISVKVSMSSLSLSKC